MRVFVDAPPTLSRAMTRVARALTEYAPLHVQITKNPIDADLVMLHVIGYHEAVKDIDLLVKRGQQFGIIQYCLRSTEKPSTASWAPIWAEAQVVWSYYDLRGATEEDALFIDAEPNWYISPLGVDTRVFYPVQPPREREFTILTSGYVAESECVNEAATAVHRVGGYQFHLGPNLNFNGTRVRHELGISDQQLADVYRSSQFVAGLRRGEGFELPAAEGLLCGARPILFDRSHYRRWYDGFAEFIPEGSPDEVTDALEALFRKGPRPVSHAELLAARDVFDWETLVSGFWEKAVG